VEWCCMCRSGESIDHFLLHCEVAIELWSAFFTLFRDHWVLPARVVKVLDCWRGQVGSRLVLDVWRMAPLCLMWSIWRERNARCFEDCEKTREELKINLVKSLFSWTMAYNISHFSKFFEFVDFCSSFSM
jgi:hypothetical protein